MTGWTVSANEEYDYGAVKLNCTVGNTVGWFGITSADPTNFPSIVGGYPGDKPLDTVDQQRPNSRCGRATGLLPERYDRRAER